MTEKEIVKHNQRVKQLFPYAWRNCSCDGGYISYWYDDFDKLSAKDKLSWLKFEYEEEYKLLSKTDKKWFIENGYTYCPLCNGGW